MSVEFPQAPQEKSPEAKLLTPVEELIPGLQLEGLQASTDYGELSAHEEENIRRAEILGSVRSMPDSYAVYALRCLGRMPEAELNKLKERFKGKVMVDLGAGMESHGYRIANLLGAKGYVGVEPYNAMYLQSYLVGETLPRYQDKTEDEQTKCAVVAEDALSFLKRIPDSAEGIVLFSSGSDANIFPDRRYNGQVIDEMARALNSGGSAVLFDSVFVDLAKRPGFRSEVAHQSDFILWVVTKE